jgi:hypothetical protein
MIGWICPVCQQEKLPNDSWIPKRGVILGGCSYECIRRAQKKEDSQESN